MLSFSFFVWEALYLPMFSNYLTKQLFCVAAQSNLQLIWPMLRTRNIMITHTNIITEIHFKTKVINIALAGWLSYLQHHPVRQKVAGLIPNQGTYLGCGFNPLVRAQQEATNWCFSPSKINKHFLGWGLKKCYEYNTYEGGWDEM